MTFMNKMKTFDPLSIKFKIIRIVCLIVFFPFVKRIRGIENVPLDRSFILASNHASFMDGLFLTIYLTRPLKKNVHYLSFYINYRNPFFRLLMETAKNIKIEPKKESKALLIAIKYLKEGKVVGIFPEGIRSPDGRIRKGRTGVSTLALRAKVPVVPVGLIGTHKVLPKGAAFPRFARCEANIGEPIRFDAFYKDYDEAIDRNDQDKVLEIEENVVRIIMKEIARLSNQEYPF